jgi:hypothetical protein
MSVYYDGGGGWAVLPLTRRRMLTKWLFVVGGELSSCR